MPSSRHHFLPVFYLKNFVNDNGTFFIYDVKKRSFRGDGQYFYPKQQFYEHHSNTLFRDDGSTDFIESGFTDHDTKVSQIIKKADESFEYELNSEEWTYLQYFVNIMHWRLPVNRNKVIAHIKSASSLKDLGIKLSSKTGTTISQSEELEYLLLLKSNPEFPKFQKLMMPAITYPEIFTKEVQDFARIMTFPWAKQNKLISDNPIIYRDSEETSLHKKEFIFPLTPTQLLLRSRLAEVLYYPKVKILVDMLLLTQANEYIATTDINYPALLIQEFESTYQSTAHLKEEIFQLIINKQKISGDALKAAAGKAGHFPFPNTAGKTAIKISSRNHVIDFSKSTTKISVYDDLNISSKIHEYYVEKEISQKTTAAIYTFGIPIMANDMVIVIEAPYDINQLIVNIS